MPPKSILPIHTLCLLISLSFNHKGYFSPPYNSIQGRNSISGIVFDENRRPIADIYVELQDEMYRALAQTKTNAAGRYSFSGLPDGYYKVKALPYGTDYEEQTQDASIINVSAAPGSGATNLYLDFHLKRKRGKDTDNAIAPPVTIFAQEVPEEAQQLYEQGLQALQERRDQEGFEKLKRAIEIFPNYYLALDRLATEYVRRGYYAAAFILFSKALEVNPRSFSSTMGLGLAQYNLKRVEDAIQSFRRATDLYNKSPDAYLWLGKSLLQTGNLNQAEQSLKKANELFQGKSAEVHWQLARMYNEQKRYRKAADELELFLKYQPDSRDAEKIRQVIKRLREKSSAIEEPLDQK